MTKSQHPDVNFLRDSVTQHYPFSFSFSVYTILSDAILSVRVEEDVLYEESHSVVPACQ